VGEDSDAGRSGQLGYYGLRSRQLEHRLHLSERVDRVLMFVGLGLALGFLADIVLSMTGVLHLIPDGARYGLLWTLALVTVCVGIFEVYLLERADGALVRQYRYMHALFAHAARELRLAGSPEARLEVLRSLGHACLAEHAQWTLAQRDKSVQGLKW
jgi:hypothetical protein